MELVTRNEHFFEKLIAQLNKDIAMSGLHGDPIEVKELEALILNLELLTEQWLRETGEQFANFCYRVDIGENLMGDIFNLDHGKNTTRVLAEQILIREMKKVILREQLKSD